MISVIMLTYNRESMVGRAIESILNQTYRDFEYIIVDNGSDDRSGEIADASAAKDPRIKVLHIEKSNIGTGRNIGLDAATGEYITFIDDDDTGRSFETANALGINGRRVLPNNSADVLKLLEEYNIKLQGKMEEI